LHESQSQELPCHTVLFGRRKHSGNPVTVKDFRKKRTKRERGISSFEPGGRKRYVKTFLVRGIAKQSKKKIHGGGEGRVYI